MTDRPILFSAPMVRALLDGTKTQTRRLLNPQPINEAISIRRVATTKDCGAPVFNFYNAEGKPIYAIPCKHGRLGEFIPRYAIGDRLWVRENWFVDHSDCMKGPYLAPEGMSHDELVDQAFLHFAATDDPNSWEAEQPKWRPSIHMPRWASRITQIVTDVRVERLQDISEEDAIAEGILVGPPLSSMPESLGDIYHDGATDPIDGWTRNPVEAYQNLWNSINGPDAWDANPWVVAVSFTVHQCNIDAIGSAA